MVLEKKKSCCCGCNDDIEKEIKLENAKFNGPALKFSGAAAPNAISLKPPQRKRSYNSGWTMRLIM